jgi:glucose/arabinose dehydrogenase
MKKSITILALFTAGLVAAPTAQKPAEQTPADAQTASDTPPANSKKKRSKSAAVKKPAGPVAQTLTLPADAVQNPDGTYSYTDKEGKKWIYSKTPFGVMRSLDGGNSSAPTPSGQSWNKVTDNGDTVTFERETPFGPIRMEKKKSELTDEERGMLDKSAVNNPSQTANPQ